MKVLPESGQRGINTLNSSCAIGSSHKLIGGGDSGQILHVEHVSIVLLDTNQSSYQKRWQHHQNPFLQDCQPENFCL